jgi:hypothetical protein
VALLPPGGGKGLNSSTLLILTDSVVRDLNLVHDTAPIQNSATFLHPNQINKPDADLFTQDLFKKLKIVQEVAGLIYSQPY